MVRRWPSDGRCEERCRRFQRFSYESGQGAENAVAVRAFLEWSLTEAPQHQASELGFVLLEGEVLSNARAAIASIRG